jgi:hypothetical protein
LYRNYIIKNNGDGIDDLEFSFSTDDTVLKDACSYTFDNATLAANDEKKVKLKIDKNNISNGTYTITINATSKNQDEIIYSKNCTIVVQLATDIKNEIINGMRIYPNPVKDALKCTLNLKKDADVALNIYTLDGKTLISKSYNSLRSGEHHLSLNIGDEIAHQGIYIFALNVNDIETIQKRIMVLK